jgi:hypothetical protein
MASLNTTVSRQSERVTACAVTIGCHVFGIASALSRLLFILGKLRNDAFILE